MCYNRFCFLEKLVTEKKISEENSGTDSDETLENRGIQEYNEKKISHRENRRKSIWQ